MDFFSPQNPGIGGIDEITDAEALTLQNISGLGNPAADRLLGWDNSDASYKFFTIGTGLTYTHATHTLSSTASGASAALDNLASVSINTSLLAQTGVDLGSTTKPFRNLFLFGGGTYGTTYIELTGTPTSTRVWTIQDTTDTFVGLATTDTLTNKTLTSPKINENVALTTTATKLNFLTSAAGTTGTTSTNIVFSTSPVLTTPNIGVATATSINGNTFTTGTYTLTGTAAKTLNFTNTLTLSGTDSTTMTFPSTSATIARTDAGQTFTGVNTFTSPSITTSIVTGSASFNAFNTTATTLNFGGAATTMTIGGTPTTAITHNYSTNATANATTKTVNLGTGGAAGSTSNINIGSSNGGTTTINSTLISLGGTTGATTTGTIELGAASDTTLSRSAAGVLAVEGVVIPSISSTNTLTNKFITPQLQSVADAGGTFTPVSITNDMGIATALSQATTIAAPTGSPVQGEKLIIRLKDNGTARALTWNAIYRASSDLALPTTTILSKTLYCGFIYNSTDTKWDLVAYLNNF